MYREIFEAQLQGLNEMIVHQLQQDGCEDEVKFVLKCSATEGTQ